MNGLNDLSHGELLSMVQSLESQLRDLYLEKRLSGLDRDQLVGLVGKLEQQHDEMVTSLSEQLADLYASIDSHAQMPSAGAAAGDEFQRLRAVAGRR